MAELWLVCEGEPGSVDINLLQRVFDQRADGGDRRRAGMRE